MLRFTSLWARSVNIDGRFIRLYAYENSTLLGANNVQILAKESCILTRFMYVYFNFVQFL